MVLRVKIVGRGNSSVVADRCSIRRRGAIVITPTTVGHARPSEVR